MSDTIPTSHETNAQRAIRALLDYVPIRTLPWAPGDGITGPHFDAKKRQHYFSLLRNGIEAARAYINKEITPCNGSDSTPRPSAIPN